MRLVPNIPEWLQFSELSATQPTWLKLQRQQQWDAFAEQGLPTRKSERWKYTDLSFMSENKVAATVSHDETQIRALIEKQRLKDDSILLVLVNGQFMPQFSDIKKSSAIICSLSVALEKYEVLVKNNMQNFAVKDHPFARLNAALFNDGIFIYIPENCVIETPIHLLSIATATNNFVAHPKHLLVLEKNSQINVLEEYVAETPSAYLMNTMTTIAAGANSQLRYYKMQHEGSAATHIANTFISQQLDSRVSMTNISLGAQFARDDVMVSLNEAGSECQTAGFYRLTNDNQYIDNHIAIDHVAPHSRSEMVYKGVLDKKSRAVFNGRLHVGAGAQKIEAQQQNHNLLLSNLAEIYSKPELEIYSDDVKCKHGATTGQLDQDALFYLRARGIEKNAAQDLLLSAFAAEILQKITCVSIKAHIEKTVQGL